jgi:pimeloyl-ACP methyl ester carboxylesterase
VIAFDRTGDGPPLVLLHPLGADRRVWDPIVDRLSEVRDVIALDIPGFGESPPLEGSVPTPSALAKAIAEQLVAIGVQRPHVAGNSLGGWVALELGLSGYARTVTAIAPAGLWPRPLVPKAGIAQRLARSFLPLIGPVAANPAGRALLLSSAVAHPRRVPRAQAARLVRAYALAPAFNEVNNAMRAGRFEGLERIRCPVTLVWPDRDQLIKRPPWVPDRIKNIVLADSGHMPMWDSPAKLAEILIGRSGGTSETAVGPRVAPAAPARELQG